MNDKTTATLGRTKLVYNEQGQLISQSLPESAYNRPTPDLPTRPKRPAPLPLAEILAQVENVERELADATAAYERSLEPGQADPHQAEKCDLVLKIQRLRSQLDPLEARLKELQSLPSPAAQYRNKVAESERLANGAAMQLTQTLAEDKSEEIYQQSLTLLPRDVQKLVLNRRDVSVVKDVAAAGFCRFGRTPEEVRTAEQAKSTAGRIVQAIALIRDTIKKHIS